MNDIRAPHSGSPPTGWISRFPLAWQWIMLIGLSLGLGLFLAALGIPAAMLLGPMLAGIAVTVAGASMRAPDRIFVLVQGLIGCMIAKMLPTSIFEEVGAHGLIFVGAVLSVIAICGVLGWAMTRLRMLPGTTALWGLSPGAASVMTLMAEAHGADVQLVAVMQYLRVVMVAASASALMRIWGMDEQHAVAAVSWFPSIGWLPFAETLALAILGPIIGQRLRIPGGALLVPLVAGIFLVRQGWMSIELPHGLLAIAYAFVGWRIGLRFTRPLLRHALKALPRIVACLAILIMLCGGLAALLVVVAGVDPLTAYLATSPGGADSVAIIASTSHVDVPFVMAMQMLRFVTVLILGPVIARFMASSTDPTPEV
jgi:membrane AbrB-like protein